MDSVVVSDKDAFEITEYQNSLKILRARRQWLEVIREFFISLTTSPPEEVNLKHILEQVSLLTEHAATVKCPNNLLEVLQKNAIYSVAINNNRRSEDFINSVSGIDIAINEVKRSPKNYREEIVSLRFKYAKTMFECRNNMLRMISAQQETSDDLKSRLTSMERILRKVNVTRTLIFLLIAEFCRDATHPHLQKYRSSTRRDLTLEDFRTGWNLGM